MRTAHSLSALLWRALTLRCPHCSIGRPLRRWFSVEPVCGHCGLKIQREPGYFVGAIYISYFLAVVPVVIGFYILPRFISLPIAWQLALWVALALLLSLTTVRIGRSLWLAIDYFFDPWEPCDSTAADFGPSIPTKRGRTLRIVGEGLDPSRDAQLSIADGLLAVLPGRPGGDEPRPYVHEQVPPPSFETASKPLPQWLRSARMRRFASFMLFLALGLALVAGAAGIDGSKLIDLSHGYGTETLYWPTGKPFEWRKTAWGMNDSGLWYAAAEFSTPEHSGTHIDAPIHFGQGQSSVDQIPVSQLIGPAAVVDIASKCAADPDYRLSRVDLEFWESAHGQIPDGAIVVARTGWYHRWPDRKSYMGSDVPGDTTHLHFPGFSKEAAQFLVQQRQIRGVGLDTASMDFGPSQDFIVHQVLNGANKYGLENLTNLDALPATGATLIVAPMKIEGGSGAPARIYALLP